jgi:DNA (cytosine-5)-methyltransferase 1
VGSRIYHRGMTTIDLFAGAGGITEGFRQAGFNCLFANDFNDWAVETFRLNHQGVPVFGGPIEELDALRIMREIGLVRGELDCLVGGPPCQGFSINAPERFLEDPRNKLFKHYLRFVDAFHPKTFVFENVPGMLSLACGEVFQRIFREMEARGYLVEAKVLFAAHYGVPQERWRLILLGTRIGLAMQHPTPRHFLQRRANFSGGSTLTFRLDESHQTRLRPPATVRDAILDLPAPLPSHMEDVGIAYNEGLYLGDFASAMREGANLLFNHVAPKMSEINRERLKHIRPGGSWRDIPHDLLPAGMQKARRSDHTKRYGRLHPDGLASTIMTKCDPHWGPVFHPTQDRTLSVREAARFQTFPDRYRFLGPRVSQYEQVGNAVPPLLARAVAETVREHLGLFALEAVG